MSLTTELRVPSEICRFSRITSVISVLIRDNAFENNVTIFTKLNNLKTRIIIHLCPTPAGPIINLL